ncbi:MAG: hypothetical protein HYW88_02595 [Candidatus Sungbacteria bacterium]|nr:hypothetical protein [Candidatus Sungbacteria bacterium]
MNKTIGIVAAVAIVVGGVSFYGGMKYDQSRSTASGRGAFTDLTPEERQARVQQFGGAGGAGGGARRIGGGSGMGGVISGDILSKDDKSITVKLNDGGSKIVFLSDSTQVMKAVSGSLADLAIGERVTTTGTPNADGSITAQTVQIRPELPAGATGGQPQE